MRCEWVSDQNLTLYAFYIDYIPVPTYNICVEANLKKKLQKSRSTKYQSVLQCCRKPISGQSVMAKQILGFKRYQFLGQICWGTLSSNPVKSLVFDNIFR